MKASGRRVGKANPPSKHSAQASIARNVIQSMEGKSMSNSSPTIRTNRGLSEEALKNKIFNTVKRGERYRRAMRAITTVDAMIANRVLTPPSRKPPA